MIAHQEIGVLNSKFKLRESEERVARHFEDAGWTLHYNRMIRGRIADLVAEKNGKLAIIEVKGRGWNRDNAIRTILHFKNAANYAYLAIPGALGQGMENMCRELGVGLIIIDGDVREAVLPQETEALDSVRGRILNVEKKRPAAKRKSLLQTLFRSKTLVHVLGFLLLNQTGEFYLNELAQRVGLAPSTVLRELNRVEPLDIISKTKKGTAVFYRINRDCIIHEELRRIFLKFELADKIIAKELAQYDIRYALIYGSFAKGTETESSDIDLLVIGQVSRDRFYESVSSLESKIGREINAIVWDDQQFRSQKERSSLLGHMNLNEIIMVRGNEDGFRRAIAE